MKKAYKFFLVLSLFFFSAYSHEDIIGTKDFGNVKVRIKTGYLYEEINKIFLFGEIAEELAKKLNYTDQIFLDFDHYYLDLCEKPTQFISFDYGNNGTDITYNGLPEKNLLEKESIVIRQCSDFFDLQKTLQLLEYAIKNVDTIINKQQEIVYNKNYCKWKIKSIDNELINKIFDYSTSNTVCSLLDKKVHLSQNKNEISYYIQNEIFTVTHSIQKQTKEIIKLNDIYFIYKITPETVILFDTRKSFYYINKNKISKKHFIPCPISIIEYEPYNIKKDDNNISFYYYLTLPTKSDKWPFKRIKIEHNYSIIEDKLTIDTTDIGL